MSIHRKHRSRDQRLKTKVSTRKLALHGALLDEELAQPLSFLSSVLRNSRLIYDRRDEPPLRIGPPS